MTWNGLQGFQTPIEDESFIVDNMGVFGNMHQERNLTCKQRLVLIFTLYSFMAFLTDVEFYYSGHMTPRESLHFNFEVYTNRYVCLRVRAVGSFQHHLVPLGEAAFAFQLKDRCIMNMRNREMKRLILVPV